MSVSNHLPREYAKSSIVKLYIATLSPTRCTMSLFRVTTWKCRKKINFAISIQQWKCLNTFDLLLGSIKEMVSTKAHNTRINRTLMFLNQTHSYLTIKYTEKVELIKYKS